MITPICTKKHRPDNCNKFYCRFIELDEALETLDAAIEYKNDAIHHKQNDLRKSVLLSQVRT